MSEHHPDCFSPHLDDAVFSVGAFLAVHPEVRVSTVFAGFPQTGARAGEWDRKCGFENGHEAVQARRREDRAAMACLDLSFRHGNAVEAQYRSDSPIEWPKLPGGGVGYAPLGLLHPDHKALRDYLLAPGCSLRRTVYLYEDLPYAAVLGEPVLRRTRRRLENEFGIRLTPQIVPFDEAVMRLKEAASCCYLSQLRGLSRMRGYRIVALPDLLRQYARERARCYPGGAEFAEVLWRVEAQER